MSVGWQILKGFHTHTNNRWKTYNSLLLLVEPCLGIISVILKPETVNTVFSSLSPKDFKCKKPQQHSFLEDKHAFLCRYFDQSIYFVVTCNLTEVAICRLVLGTFVLCLLLVQIDSLIFCSDLKHCFKLYSQGNSCCFSHLDFHFTSSYWGWCYIC